MTPRKKPIFICFIYNGWMKIHNDTRAGIMRYARNHPDWVVKILNLQVRHPEIVLRKFLSFGFNGIIGTNVPERFILKHLPPDARDIPRVAFAHTPHRDCAPIIAHIDYDAAIDAAIQLFRRLGISNFACVGTSNRQIARTSRQFCHKMSRRLTHGTTFEEFLLFEPSSVDGRNTGPSEYERLGDWVDQLPKPCGILACMDNNAKDILDVCRIRGIDVPSEVAVCSIGNDPLLCENLNPTLTSIEMDFDRAAYQAAMYLDRMIHAEAPVPRRVIHCGVKEIVERESTQDRLGTGRILALALEYIRVNACRGISVSDVARHLTISRRALEQRFHERLGFTVLDEIHRVKLEHVRRMLCETNDTIKDITFTCGFKSEIALKPLFKKHFGMTMSAWRATHPRDVER